MLAGAAESLQVAGVLLLHQELSLLILQVCLVLMERPGFTDQHQEFVSEPPVLELDLLGVIRQTLPCLLKANTENLAVITGNGQHRGQHSVIYNMDLYTSVMSPPDASYIL